MAIVTIKLAAALNDSMGGVPDGLATAIRPLLAAQRDEFVAAWNNASDEARRRPAEQWVLREEDRDVFTRFQAAMLAGTEPGDTVVVEDSGAVSEP